MKIIGHRGAAGLELENTLAGLKKALLLGVDGIEFDVRLTKDRELVLCHDPDLSKVSDSLSQISDLTLSELKKIRLDNGENIPTLREALECVGSTWAIIEVKDEGCTKELLKVLDEFPKAHFTVASFIHTLVAELEVARPELSVFLSEHTKPFEVIQFVRTAKANGIVLNAWLLNPLTYWLAKRRGLYFMVYTVNSRLVGWFINKLYPDVFICTDYPHWFTRMRQKGSLKA